MKLNRIFLFLILNTISIYGFTQDINSRYQAAKGKIDQGSYDDAINILNELIKINPDDYNYFFDLGTAYRGIKNNDKALESFNKALEKNSQCEKCYSVLAKTYLDKKNIVKAEEVANIGLSKNKNSAELYYTRGLISAQKGNNDKAILDFTNALSLDSKNTDILIARANLYIQTLSFSSAYSDISDAIKVSPNNSQYYYYRAFVLMNMNILDEALNDINKAIGINDKVPDYYNLKFSILSNRKEFDEAIKSVLKSIDLAPNDYLAYINLGDTYFQIGEFNNYCNCYQNALKYIPDNLIEDKKNIQNNYIKFCNKEQVPYYYIRSLGEYNNKNYEASISIINEGLKIAGTNSLLHNIKGTALLAEKNYNQAKNNFLKSIEFKNLMSKEIMDSYSFKISNNDANNLATSHIIKSYMGIAIAELDNHNYDEVLKNINEAIFNAESLKEFTGIEYLYNINALAYIGKNNISSAYSELTKSISINPQNSISYLNIAITKILESCSYSSLELKFDYIDDINSPRVILPELKITNNNETILNEAVEICDNVIKSQPQNAIAFLIKAKISLLQNDLTKACEYAKKAKEYGIATSFAELNINCN